MAERHWLIKSEPSKYPFEQLLRDRKTVWDGIRNFQARNNLRAMKTGDALLYYHSNEGKSVVGLARVVAEAYPDPTSTGDFSAVDIAAVRPLVRPISLNEMRAHPSLSEMQLFKQGRLSVVPVTRAEFDEIVRLGSGPDPQ